MPEDTTPDSPFACNLSAMDDGLRHRHQVLVERLHPRILEIAELPGGYGFCLPSDDDLVLIIAEFITLERRCCPFIDFTLDISRDNGPMWLRLTGRDGIKPFLRAEFGIDQAIGAS